MLRNKHTHLATNLRAAKRRMEDASNAANLIEETHVRALNLIQGYKYTLTLSPVILAREDADIFEQILDVIKPHAYSSRGNLDLRTILPHHISVKTFTRLSSNPELQPYLHKYFDCIKGSSPQLYTWEVSSDSQYYRWKWDAAFTPLVTPHFHTWTGYLGIKYADSPARRKLAEATSHFNSLGGWDAWYKLTLGYVSYRTHGPTPSTKRNAPVSTYSNPTKALRAPIHHDTLPLVTHNWDTEEVDLPQCYPFTFSLAPLLDMSQLCSAA